MSTATTEPPIVRREDSDAKPSPRRSHARKPAPAPKIVVGQGRAKREPISTDDVDVEQKSAFEFSLEDAFEHPGGEIIIPPEVLKADYEEAIKFSREPVEIYIQPSPEKFGAKTVPCWVNGKGIELFDKVSRRWYETGEIPRGMDIITRRMYVEVLLRSKTDAYVTEIIRQPGEEPVNKLVPGTAVNYPIQIVQDVSPHARQWFTRMVGFRG